MPRALTLVFVSAFVTGAAGTGAGFVDSRSAVPALAQQPTAAATRQVTVNRVTVSAQELERLERQYPVRVFDGDYWYDRNIGFWGVLGGPTVGLIFHGLEIGGPLPADASGGGTGYFLNGRELHAADVLVLRLFAPDATPGRYWINPSGQGGLEGGPPFFNLWTVVGADGPSGPGRSWFARGARGGRGISSECRYHIGGPSSGSMAC